MTRFACFVFVATLIGIVDCSGDERPNILLVMADDLGYADIGCFGSEIQTPHIDSLASDGLQFSHFRATPMCVTSRIAIMSGMPMHRAGAHNYSHSIPLAKLLKRGGYRTMMTGKWHGGTPSPRSRDLFDRSFGFLGGATDSFVGGKDWFLDDQPFADFGDDFYATREFARRSIDFMKESVSAKQPFFMYVAFNAPHHPCQAPKQTVDKYAKTYLRGYDALRNERLQKQVALGLADQSWTPAPIGYEVRQWNELTDHRKTIEAGRMAAYAAAVDEVDQGVGQMLEYLRDAEIADNTLVIFLSDNGGDYSNGSITEDEKQIAWMPGANPSSSNGWASVKCTPFRYYKHACHEGGIATPMVIRWPAGVTRPTGQLIDAPTSITDIYPTLIELAGIDYPDSFAGKRVRPLSGASLRPLFDPSGTRPAVPLFQWYQFSRAWIDDDWKAVRLYDGPWQLFNLRTDRTESNDLSADHPELLAKMVKEWTQFAAQSGVPNARDASSNIQPGWGWHRLQMALPGLKSLTPANGSISQSSLVELSLTFDQPIDFTGTVGKNICLYDVSDESQPIWQADPDRTHSGQGQLSVTFDDLPTLSPDKHYAIRSDRGWIKLGKRNAGSLNDGAFWWRFRTPSTTDGNE